MFHLCLKFGSTLPSTAYKKEAQPGTPAWQLEKLLASPTHNVAYWFKGDLDRQARPSLLPSSWKNFLQNTSIRSPHPLLVRLTPNSEVVKWILTKKGSRCHKMFWHCWKGSISHKMFWPSPRKRVGRRTTSFPPTPAGRTNTSNLFHSRSEYTPEGAEFYAQLPAQHTLMTTLHLSAIVELT